MTITKSLTAFQESQLTASGVHVPDVSFMPAVVIMDATMQGDGGQRSDRGKIGNDHFSWPNESHEPHLTETSRYEDGLLPYPNTNYTWRGIAEQLHTHIARLQARRQKLAREAELLWQWLARKEAEM